jgi:ABC-type Mn2+/Zn2+ transport system permease subunit
VFYKKSGENMPEVYAVPIIGLFLTLHFYLISKLTYLFEYSIDISKENLLILFFIICVLLSFRYLFSSKQKIYNKLDNIENFYIKLGLNYIAILFIIILVLLVVVKLKLVSVMLQNS